MATRKQANAYAARLAALTKVIAKSRPEQLHRPLFDVFVIYAAAGDVARASRILDWMYGRVPPPTAVATALSTQALDGFCAAAGLGDRTQGLPRLFPQAAGREGLAARVEDGEAQVRQRLLSYAYGGEVPTDDSWEQLPAGDPWRRNRRWGRIQRLAAEGQEQEALERLDRYLDELRPDDRGAGYGNELTVALDLGLRLGERERTEKWLAQHGHRFASDDSLLAAALCLPAVAQAIASGALCATVGLSEAEREGALEALDGAVQASLNATPKAVPKTQRRRVSCEYSQVHLEPATLDATELAQEFFQQAADSERGMSLFPTKVGIATPNETAAVEAEISLARRGLLPEDLQGVVQAVAFPLHVRGPLRLRSVTAGDEDEPLVVPPGTYDVLARFFPKKAPRATAAAGLRVFRLAITLHPEGALDAPQTLRLEAEA